MKEQRALGDFRELPNINTCGKVVQMSTIVVYDKDMQYQEWEIVTGASGRKYVVIEDNIVVSRHPSFHDNRKSKILWSYSVVCLWCFNVFLAKMTVRKKKNGKKYFQKPSRRFCTKACELKHRWDSYTWNQHIDELRANGPKTNTRKPGF